MLCPGWGLWSERRVYTKVGEEEEGVASSPGGLQTQGAPKWLGEEGAREVRLRVIWIERWRGRRTDLCAPQADLGAPGCGAVGGARGGRSRYCPLRGACREPRPQHGVSLTVGC